MPIHNMLGSTSLLPRVLKVLLPCLFPLIILGVAISAFRWNAEQVFFGGNVYFSDGDCYARMTRVRMLQEHPFSPVHRHDFENYPIGTVPHTTSPLDILIGGISAIISPFAHAALPLAGAWISPLLGLLTLGMIAVWWRKVAFANATLLLLAVSPIVSHGFLLGRPDHQSLLMLLLAAALTAEIEIWSGKPRGVVSAVAWALALWVSLFEPLILLLAVLGLRLCTRRLRFERKALIIFFVILLAGVLVDGFPVTAFDAHFSNWSRNIGELRHGSLSVLFSWVGWLAVPAPLALLFGFLRKKDPVCLLLSVLMMLLTGLVFWYVRWGYFYAIVFALSLPWVLPMARWKPAGWVILILSLWPVAADWDGRLYPSDDAFRARAESVTDAVALREAAIQLKDLPKRGVIAPWWFSPAIVWWSGQPCVAGTSHQSLPGIVDTAEYFLAEDEGMDILKRRKVGYIFAYEPARVVSNSAQILGRPAPFHPLATRLYEHPRAAEFPLLYANRFFKVFEKPADQK